MYDCLSADSSYHSHLSETFRKAIGKSVIMIVCVEAVIMRVNVTMTEHSCFRLLRNVNVYSWRVSRLLSLLSCVMIINITLILSMCLYFRNFCCQRYAETMLLWKITYCNNQMFLLFRKHTGYIFAPFITSSIRLHLKPCPETVVL